MRRVSAECMTHVAQARLFRPNQSSRGAPCDGIQIGVGRTDCRRRPDPFVVGMTWGRLE